MRFRTPQYVDEEQSCVCCKHIDTYYCPFHESDPSWTDINCCLWEGNISSVTSKKGDPDIDYNEVQLVPKSGTPIVPRIFAEGSENEQDSYFCFQCINYNYKERICLLNGESTNRNDHCFFFERIIVQEEQ